MTTMQAHEIALTELGCSEDEMAIYLLLLQFKRAKVQQITAKTKINRTTLYNVLDKLIQKGLCSSIVESGVKQFLPTPPEKLPLMLEEKKKMLLDALPYLQGLYGGPFDVSKAEVFQGSKGIAAILNDLLLHPEELRYFGSIALSREQLKHVPFNFIRKRIESKIPARIIFEPSKEEYREQSDYYKYTKIRYLDFLKDYPIMLFVYSNKVAFYTLKGDVVGVIIQNSEVNKAFGILFEILWSQARETIA
ncbi:MAG: helix-turn-helix domain-containing protein [Candidatus Woesearchaeota archaeon]